MRLLAVFAAVFFLSFALFAQTSTTQLPKRTSKRPQKAAPQVRDALADTDDEEDESEDGEGEETERPWAAVFQSFNEVQSGSLNRREFSESGDALMLNMVGFDYRIFSSVKVGAAQEWETTMGLGENRAQNRLLDTYVQLKDEAFFKLGNVEAKSHLRFYLPSGEESREIEQILRVRYELALERELRRFTVRYILRPEYHFQKYLAFYDSATESVAGTPGLKLWNLAELEYRISEKLKIRQALGVADTWFNGDSNYDLSAKRSEDFISETGLNWEATDNLAFEVGIYEWAPDLLAQDRAFSLYRDDEANYFLYTELAF
ncbi:MAG: hypothetical protein ABL958_03405 [Bdellovibrionia bacterium]